MKSQRYRISNDKFGGQMAKDFLSNITRGGLKYRDHILPSGYFESQTWGALHNCWVGFMIAKAKMEGIR
jgi:hypothetical protein